MALPYGERALKEKLEKLCKISGYPMVAVVNVKTGECVTSDGRSKVGSPEQFPWKPPTKEEVAALGGSPQAWRHRLNALPPREATRQTAPITTGRAGGGNPPACNPPAWVFSL